MEKNLKQARKLEWEPRCSAQRLLTQTGRVSPAPSPETPEAAQGRAAAGSQGWAGNGRLRGPVRGGAVGSWGRKWLGATLAPSWQHARNRAGAHRRDPAPDPGRCLRLLTVSSRGRQATRPAASTPPPGTPAYGTCSGSQRHGQMQASQDKKGTAFPWQEQLSQGLALLPGCPALAEWIDPEVKQESPSLGLHCLCPRLPQGPETPGLLGSSDWEGQLLLVCLCPCSPPLGPLASSLSDHQPTLESLEAKPGETAASLGTGRAWPPAPTQQPTPALKAQPESSVCTASEGCLSPASWRGQEIRWGTEASRRLECGQGRAGGKRGEVLSFPNQAGSVCCVCISGRGEYVGWRL